MTGQDGTYAQTTHARHLFYPELVRDGYRTTLSRRWTTAG